LSNPFPVYNLLGDVNLYVSSTWGRFLPSTNLPSPSFSMIVGETRGHIGKNQSIIFVRGANVTIFCPYFSSSRGQVSARKSFEKT